MTFALILIMLTNPVTQGIVGGLAPSSCRRLHDRSHRPLRPAIPSYAVIVARSARTAPGPPSREDIDVEMGGVGGGEGEEKGGGKGEGGGPRFDRLYR